MLILRIPACQSPRLTTQLPLPTIGSENRRRFWQISVVEARLDDAGATDSGMAYVYDLSSLTPTIPIHTLSNPTPGVSENFANSVTISESKIAWAASPIEMGRTLRGRLHLRYGISHAGDPVQTILSPVTISSQSFGYSVSLSANRLAVGDIWVESSGMNTGGAYLFDLSSATPSTPIATMINPAPGDSDDFGWVVALSGNTSVVGAPNDDAIAKNSGSAHVYEGVAPSQPTANLLNPTKAVNDAFGKSVAVSDQWMVVGSTGEDSGADRAGGSIRFRHQIWRAWFTDSFVQPHAGRWRRIWNIRGRFGKHSFGLALRLMTPTSLILVRFMSTM